MRGIKSGKQYFIVIEIVGKQLPTYQPSLRSTRQSPFTNVIARGCEPPKQSNPLFNKRHCKVLRAAKQSNPLFNERHCEAQSKAISTYNVIARRCEVRSKAIPSLRVTRRRVASHEQAVSFNERHCEELRGTKQSSLIFMNESPFTYVFKP